MAGRQVLAALLLLAACAAQDTGPRYANIEPERWKVRVGVPSFGEQVPAASAAAAPACICRGARALGIRQTLSGHLLIREPSHGNAADSHPFWFNGTGSWAGPGVTESNDSRWTAEWTNVPNGGNWCARWELDACAGCARCLQEVLLLLCA